MFRLTMIGLWLIGLIAVVVWVRPPERVVLSEPVPVGHGVHFVDSDWLVQERKDCAAYPQYWPNGCP